MHLFHKKLNIMAEKLATSDFDFYASVITPWHLINVQACINELAKNRSIKGVLIIGCHPKSGYCVKKESVVCLSNVDMTVIYDTEFENLSVKPYKNEKSFYVIYPMTYQFELGKIIEKFGNRKVYLVKTDEGLMEYYDKTHLRRVRADDGMKKRMPLKVLADKIILMLCKLGWDKSQLMDRFLMKRNSEGLYEPQMSVVESVRNYLQLISEPIVHENEKYCMFLSFSWDECNMWDKTEYKKLLTDVNKVLNSINVKLYIKPHPREENIERYKEWGVDIFDNDNQALEILLANLTVKPIAMIGLDSTALINASMLGNCCSISLKHLITKELTSKNMWSGLESFEEKFAGYVEFVDSPEEIIKFVQA